MMTQDSLGDLSMKPTRDEMAQRQPKRSKPVRNANSGGSKPPQGATEYTQAALWSALMILVLCSAAGGWYLWDKVERMQASLSRSTQALASAESALSNLQKKIENRDTTLSKSGDQMAADLKSLDTEIRKLWDLSNKRNKVDIAEQKKISDKLTADLKQNQNEVNGFSKQLTASTVKVSGLQKDVAELKERNGILTSLLEAQRKDVQTVKAQIGSASDFDDRMTRLELAIKAIDSHRQQVNARLEKMDKEIGVITQRLGNAG